MVMARQKYKEPIFVEVNFTEPLHRKSVAKVTIELLKNLLHQRHQIPVQYDAIHRDVKNASIEDSDDNFNQIEPEDSVQDIKKKRQAARKELLRQRYLKRAAVFVETCEETFAAISDELNKSEERIENVSFVFGATPFSPRETYTLLLPNSLSKQSSVPCQRPGLQLFRSMVTDVNLFNLLTSSCQITKVFTIIQRRDATSSPGLETWFTPEPDFELTTRGRLVQFQLQHPEPIEQVTFRRPLETVQRLRFESGPVAGSTQMNGSSRVDSMKPLDHLQTPSTCRSQLFNTPARLRVLSGGASSDRYTPVPMELCTPGPAKTANVPETFPHCMDLCTPAQKQQRLSKIRENGMNSCTPALKPQRLVCETSPTSIDEMEPCTPFHGGIQVCNGGLGSPESPDVLIRSFELGDFGSLTYLVCPVAIKGFKDPQVVRAKSRII